VGTVRTSAHTSPTAGHTPSCRTQVSGPVERRRSRRLRSRGLQEPGQSGSTRYRSLHSCPATSVWRTPTLASPVPHSALCELPNSTIDQETHPESNWCTYVVGHVDIHVAVAPLHVGRILVAGHQRPQRPFNLRLSLNPQESAVMRWRERRHTKSGPRTVSRMDAL
jgi:hypothetical protein